MSVLENLDRISVSNIGSITPDDIAAAQVQDQLLEERLAHARLNRFLVDTALRRHLTYIFSIVIFLWLAAVISILYFNDNVLYLNLSENVLITLLTTSSVNVIGMMLIILKNLFPNVGSDN